MAYVIFKEHYRREIYVGKNEKGDFIEVTLPGVALQFSSAREAYKFAGEFLQFSYHRVGQRPLYVGAHKAYSGYAESITGNEVGP